jgi:hypothetical protein
MADLLDIVPSTAVEVVKIDGRRYTVRGLSIPAIASIAKRFPELKSILSGDVGGDIVLRMIAAVGAATGPIIAAGFGHLGDEKYEQHAETLLSEQQLKLIRAILGLTFPNGIGPFVQELTNLLGGASKEVKVHKVHLKQSPSTSQTLSDEGSHPTMQ